MEDLTGKQLGPYQIVAPLGEGGMAAVYKAYQPNMDRYVALKVLPRHFASDPEFVGRFSQEARVIANLQHPHILPVHDFGEADGYTYLTMRYVESGTLADWLKDRQPLSLEKIRAIISQVGGALDYAHAQGVVHRDIKPSNILVDEWNNCLLTDFGLAKMVESSSKLTQTGGILGTPAYMSPEQGLGKKIDSRSDIYSLGVVLYQMAIGRLPYQAETPMAVVIKHIHDPLPPPSKFKEDIPDMMERAILKALAKDPQDRFTSVGEMVIMLQSATEKTTIAASPIPPEPEPVTVVQETAVIPPEPTVPPLPPVEPTVIAESHEILPAPRSKRKFLYAGLGLIAVIAILWLILTLVGGGDEESGPDISEGTNQDIQQEPESIDALLAAVDEAYETGDVPLALNALDQAIELEPDLADLHCQRGYALRELEDNQAAVTAFETCSNLANDQELPDLYADALGEGVMTHVRQILTETDDPGPALDIIDEALQNPEAPSWLVCERGEFSVWHDNERAISDFETCMAENSDDEYWTGRSEAVINMILGYQALETEDQYAAIDHFNVWAELETEAPWPHCAMGDARISLGEFAPALDEYKLCQELAAAQDDTEAEKHALGNQYYTQARLALFDSDLPLALENYSQAIELAPDQPHMFCERGMLHHELGAIEEARTDYAICLELFHDDPDGRNWAEELLLSLEKSN